MQNLFEMSAVVVAAIPITVGVVQVVKKVGLTDKWAPLASLLVGAGLVFLSGAVWQIVIAQGIIVGLAASGLYSSGKTINENLNVY